VKQARRAPEIDRGFLDRALALAERGRATVAPNPLVGCVVVLGDQVVGEGWHQRAGGPHAEIAALRAAGGNARDATVYVTLEPCAHQGRTPPCTDALIQAGVARVVVALADPNPLAAGGAARLRGAGIAVDMGPGDHGLAVKEARWQNRVWLHALASDRPHITLKLATSLDGMVAAADGTSQWLTGPDTRRRAHELRAGVDAVLVGSGTVLADDPRLTVRLEGHAGPQPLRVVLDSRARTPLAASVLGDQAPTVIVVSPAAERSRVEALETAGVETWTCRSGPWGADLAHVLDGLRKRGVTSLLVEGGPTVAASFLRAGLVDELVCHIAPLVLPGGRPMLAGLGIPTLAQAPRFATVGVERVGEDVLLTLASTRVEPIRVPPAVPAAV